MLTNKISYRYQVTHETIILDQVRCGAISKDKSLYKVASQTQGKMQKTMHCWPSQSDRLRNKIQCCCFLDLEKIVEFAHVAGVL